MHFSRNVSNNHACPMFFLNPTCHEFSSCHTPIAAESKMGDATVILCNSSLVSETSIAVGYREYMLFDTAQTCLMEISVLDPKSL